ncbi:MAG: calycin-like domain-containing protein [Muribaculaceae bacterium]|nr:calycin-like domain-containing protein [Muribaculaceae bacterium]
MKKLFVIFAAACCAMAINATNYTCHIKVTINGESTEQEEVPVVVTQNNGVYNLSLNNFVLWVGDFPMPVGNIAVSDVEGVDEYGYTTIKFNDNINITEGDDPQYDTWAGPLLGDVPIDLTARFIDTALSAHIDIDMMSMIGQVIGVELFGVAPALEGDVNHDGEVNVSDVNKVIDIILSK